MVAEGRVSPSSLTYVFLITMLNFAIRNAGVVKLREIIMMSQAGQGQRHTIFRGRSGRH
jgi:hypothetical protein